MTTDWFAFPPFWGQLQKTVFSWKIVHFTQVLKLFAYSRTKWSFIILLISSTSLTFH